MTPRERWLAVLRRERPDRVPMDLWATPEVLAALRTHFRTDDIWEVYRRLGVDRPIVARPAYVGPPVPPDGDVFGCRYVEVDYGPGRYRECVHHPLAECETVAEIEGTYAWPRAEWWDFSVLPGQLAGREEHPVEGGGSEPFLVYKELRGQERAFLDLVERPEIVAHCLGRLFDFQYEYTARILRALPGRVTYSYVAEDLGAERALMLSPAHIRRFLLPGMRRMAALVRGEGAFVFCHSDGAIRPVIPDLLELPIDLLNPIQWRCAGMDREGLKRDFGDRVVFHGGVDNQHTLPFGSPEEVAAEVAENLRTLGAGGGYILAPCHNIQPNTPVENILALYAAGRELGRTG